MWFSFYFVCSLLCFAFETGSHCVPLTGLGLLCRSSWIQIHRDPLPLLPSDGFKGLCHRAQPLYTVWSCLKAMTDWEPHQLIISVHSSPVTCPFVLIVHMLCDMTFTFPVACAPCSNHCVSIFSMIFLLQGCRESSWRKGCSAGPRGGLLHPLWWLHRPAGDENQGEVLTVTSGLNRGEEDSLGS